MALKQACAIDVRDKHGHTLLFNAAMGVNQVLVEELIALGANVNDADQLGWTPLHAAVSRGDVEMTKFLLKCGADIRVAVKDDAPWDVDWPPRQDYSNVAIKTLHLALLSHLETAHPRPLQLLRLLLRSSMDKQVVSTPIEQAFGFTQNVHYIREGESLKEAIEMAELLVQRGAAVGDVALNLTLEQIAQFEGHEELWEALRQGVKGSKGSADDE
ncbi:ankyrin repeat-containing domain protein [Achaetomium macrosporum]|uniref:Ankyrin repeat-containing domain protein n=1 Tax=Achaetomium macrosporum TaxID=79813 RepID=A0AAN7C0W6_9PEZI|nr:ankyrin repeat-containing domain protein [Achaetomium macrosporum]